tara:strand:- start:2960 stop:4189 length:1230 start_codon:yes stop_codon:yes gene_type:complete
MFIFYNILINIFSIFFKIYLQIRVKNNKEHPKRYLEKLAITNLAANKDRIIWFHAASVGELLSIFPLIDKLLKENLFEKILVTSITLSSSQIFEKKYTNNKKIIHQFLPMDKIEYIKNFLDHWNPNALVLIESEIWPNLIHEVKKNEIPLILLNARITSKTFSKWKFLKNFSFSLFKKIDLCISSNKETEIYLEKLGAKKIKNFGNLKFSRNVTFQNKKQSKKKIWCAVSTHPSEEVICAKAHLKLKSENKNILGIIIPRHISRINSIKKSLLNFNLEIQTIKENENIKDSTDILLVNTYGEVTKYLSLSHLAFLGGSLVNHGGQNPIEAAKLGCKICHGPYIQNFWEVYEYLNNTNLSKVINNDDELYKFLKINFHSDFHEKENIIKVINEHGENILNNIVKEIKTVI